MNISQAIYAQPDAIGIVRFGDLREFALELIAEAERKTEERLQQQSETEAQRNSRLTREEVIKTYGISSSTLTRWRNIGYLCPDGYIGRKPYYNSASIERVIDAKKSRRK